MPEIAPTSLTELMSALPLPGASGVPEWIHLVPAGLVQTNDKRGPYQVAELHSVIEASMVSGRLPVDENHSVHLAARQGNPSPAVGWIVEMDARDDGLWGRVEWNATGTQLMSERAYRHISPAVTVRKSDKRIVAIQAASLVNRPNLQNLVSLHSENTMTFLEQIADALGLGGDATEETALHALTERLAGGGSSTELQSTLDNVATALGVEGGAAGDVLIATANSLREGAGGQGEMITALQSEVTALRNDRLRDAATAYVDKAIAEKRAGVSASRDTYIDLHMQDPAKAETLIKGLPQLGVSHIAQSTAPGAETTLELNAEVSKVAELLGQDATELAKDVAKEQEIA